MPKVTLTRTEYHALLQPIITEAATAVGRVGLTQMGIALHLAQPVSYGASGMGPAGPVFGNNWGASIGTPYPALQALMYDLHNTEGRNEDSDSVHPHFSNAGKAFQLAIEEFANKFYKQLGVELIVEEDPVEAKPAA